MNIDDKTIKDFGRQWTIYNDTKGFFGSVELLADFIAPFDIEDFKGKQVADIGSGTGRFALSLLDVGCQRVIAVEPSEAVEVIKAKMHQIGSERITILNIKGDQIPSELCLDYAISIGVLHHIRDPDPVIQAVFNALKPGGKFIVWLYGKEGNELYLLLILPIRFVSKSLPHWGKVALTTILDWPLRVYIAICKTFPSLRLPLSDYMISVLGKLDPAKRRIVIYDQLNPQYAKYYNHDEAYNLMKRAPFNVDIHHRRGYSWVVIGTKPQIQ